MKKVNSNVSAGAFRPALSDNNEDVPLAMVSEIVNDLRITFATYQMDGKPLILLRHLVEIMLMMGVKQEKIPPAEKLAAMAGIKLSASEDAWETEVDFKKFIRLFIVLNMKNKTVEVKSKDIFRALDRDDSGEITAEELVESLTSMGMELNDSEALAMTSIADTSNEGLISYAQFKSICKRIDREK